MAKRKRKLKVGSPDYLLFIVATLLIIGLVMVYSSSFGLAYEAYDNPNYFLIRQITWAMLGTIALLVMGRIEYHIWQRLSIPIMVVVLVSLVVVLFVGSERFGSRRSFFNGSLQPSEPCKLGVIIYIAVWLSSKGEKLRQLTYGLIPFAVLIGLVAGLIMSQPDFGTSLLIVATTVAMFLIAGADLVQLLIGLAFGGATIGLLVKQIPYVMERVHTFMNPLGDPSGAGYHIGRLLFTLAKGGISGVGLFAGHQIFGYIPASHTDSIFAIIGGELGLIGCLIVLGLFIALAYRGLRIALQAPDTFGTILASGITCWLVFQALINMAAVTSTIPFTGITLPFISFGGSSLVTSMAGIGLLLSISKGSRTARVERSASFDFGRWNRRTRLSRTRRR